LTFLDHASVSLPGLDRDRRRLLQTHGLWFGHHSRASADERLFHDARQFRRRAGPRHVEALGVRRHGQTAARRTRHAAYAAAYVCDDDGLSGRLYAVADHDRRRVTP
jgi:hypothetical protein